MILEKINSPNDLKELSLNDLVLLSNEIRNVLIEKVTTTGGHLSPNLGIVELTIALHYVFDSPNDKMIFDVSHQSYVHKILTGRKDAFINPEKYKDVSGYTTPNESKHDLFKVGHTSTSVSLACGLAKARDINGRKENVLAIIGDGSMSGGEAFEGLNNASKLGSNFIVIFNDNEMSIAPPQGGLHDHFAELRRTNGKSANNYFKALGFDYTYIEEGNDLEILISRLKEIKDIDHPIVVHIHTLKGKGMEWAEENKELSHSIESRKAIEDSIGKESYIKLTSEFLLKKIKEDKRVVVITAATPLATGLTLDFRKEAKEQFIDVGICEEHAVAFSSALAKGGIKPIYEIKSTFAQRVYDQLNQDLAMNNSPATILMFEGKISGGDCTHNGIFDIAMVSSIPNLVCLAPTNLEEYYSYLDYAIEQNTHPCLIRVPCGEVQHGKKKDVNESNLLKYEIVAKGEKIAIIPLGSSYVIGNRVYKTLKEKGYNPTLINPVNYSSLDKETLNSIIPNHEFVITIEDGVLDCGFGEKISRFFGDTNIKTICYGCEKDFYDRISSDDIKKINHLTDIQIVEDIEKLYK